MKFERPLSKKEMKEALDQLTTMLVYLMPEVIMCPYCQEIDARKTVYAVDNRDVFALCYACLECTMISTLQIDKTPPCGIIGAQLHPDQIDILLHAIEDTPENRDFRSIITEQKKWHKDDSSKTGKAHLN